jgi:aryl-alcohol dehydrogenase-like predicted oxidoreductase
MNMKQLGNSDLFLSGIGIGAWAMGGGNWAFGWGPQDDADSIAAIRTAAVYGLGHAEEVVAKAVAGLSPQPLVFTKCGRIWDEQRQIGKRLKRESIMQECEASLRRLQRETIDLYQIHWPEPDEEVEEGWEAMLRLKEQGKARWIGVSNFSVGQMQRAQSLGAVTSLQPPYSMIVPGVEEEILPYAAQQNIGVINYSPMRNGLLSGRMTAERVAAFPADDFRGRLPDFQAPRLQAALELATKLGEIGQRSGHSAGHVAIAWTRSNPAITASILGVRNAEQARAMFGPAPLQLDDATLKEIKETRASLGFIPA